MNWKYHIFVQSSEILYFMDITRLFLFFFSSRSCVVTHVFFLYVYREYDGIMYN